MSSRLMHHSGNAAVFTIALALICIFIVLSLFDLCRIFISREHARTLSDAIALAAAQELIFLSRDNISIMARDMAAEEGCRLKRLYAGYDEIEVTVEKDTQITVLEKLGLYSLNTVTCSSRTKVIYPWDKSLGNCRYYEFGYKPY